MMYDFLFELTEYSDNEGEQILCEEASLEDAWRRLIDEYGFQPKELAYVGKLSVEEGETFGLDTY